MPLFDFLLDLLFPSRCLSCGKLGQYICDSCLSMTQFIDTNICPVCQKPAINGKTHPRCKTRYSLDGVTSFFSYQRVIRKAIKTIKYKPFAFGISRALVSLALRKINQESLLFSSFTRIVKEKPTLIPVPLHPSRERLRGFNQAEVLGKILAEEWNLPFVKDLLLRKRATKPQYRLKKEEREENIKGAFEINQKYVSGSSKLPHNFMVILFDDVWTTGATMRNCGNLLKRAGAKFVWGLTLAR